MRHLLFSRQTSSVAAACAQSSRYGDVSYSQPQNCSIITRDQRANSYAHLFRKLCEQSDARAKQSVAPLAAARYDLTCRS